MVIDGEGGKPRIPTTFGNGEPSMEPTKPLQTAKNAANGKLKDAKKQVKEQAKGQMSGDKRYVKGQFKGQI